MFFKIESRLPKPKVISVFSFKCTDSVPIPLCLREVLGQVNICICVMKIQALVNSNVNIP